MKTLAEIITKNNSKNNYWFITIFHAIGGILSAILIMLLIPASIPSILHNDYVMILSGIVFIVFTYFTTTKENTIFAEYFIFAFTLAGGALVTVGLIMILSAKSYAIGLLIVFVYSILFFFIPSLLHRFMSALLILSGSYYFCMQFNIELFYTSILFLLSIWFWLYEYNDSTYIYEKRIFAYALVLFVLFITNNHEIVTQLSQKTGKSSLISSYIPIFFYYIIGLSSISLFCYKYEFNLKISIFMLVGTMLFYYTQPTGISLAEPLFIILIAFYRKNKILMSLGILSMLNIIFNYYTIDYIDFLLKSTLLLIFGLVTLLLAFILHVYLKKQKKENYA
jgi:hypothetical protein